MREYLLGLEQAVRNARRKRASAMLDANAAVGQARARAGRPGYAERQAGGGGQTLRRPASGRVGARLRVLYPRGRQGPARPGRGARGWAGQGEGREAERRAGGQMDKTNGDQQCYEAGARL